LYSVPDAIFPAARNEEAGVAAGYLNDRASDAAIPDEIF